MAINGVVSQFDDGRPDVRLSAMTHVTVVIAVGQTLQHSRLAFVRTAGLHILLNWLDRSSSDDGPYHVLVVHTEDGRLVSRECRLPHDNSLNDLYAMADGVDYCTP